MINLNTNISKYFGVPKHAGLKYGIELEYENATLARLDSEKTPLTRWKIQSDDSLRNNGVEFISRPTAMDKLEIAVDQVLKAAHIMGARATPRCGLHVHVNMTDRTFRELFNVSTLYTLLEPVIFAEYADGRQENHFCVPTYCNTALVETVYKDVQSLRQGIVLQKTPPRSLRGRQLGKIKYTASAGITPDSIFQTGPQLDAAEVTTAALSSAKSSMCPAKLYPHLLRFSSVPKYAALNYSALRKFGTLEYRQHPATLSKFSLLEWVGLLDRIHTYALTFEDPLDVIQLFDADGLSSFCKRVELPRRKVVDEWDLEDAVDAATLMAGHLPINWKELKWEIA